MKNSFNEYISKHLLLIGFISTIFIIYPNIACLPWLWDMQKLWGIPFFLLYFHYRFFFFWILICLLIRYNLQKIPKLLFPKRFLHNLLISFAAYLFFALVSHWVSSFGVHTDFIGSTLVAQFFILTVLGSQIGYLAILYARQREIEQEVERLRSENLQSRCDALTNQINPHFFFNSLNGIQTLIRRKNDEDTLNYVYKLSDIFHYLLQSDKKGLVSLREELNFIEAFRCVMEVRFANKLIFRIDVPEAVKDRFSLPVLSLLLLVDNVVVHNMIDRDHLMEIIIESNDRNELVVSNPIYPKLTSPETNGTGLNNLDSRFFLLTEKHIRIENDGTFFIVYLPLL